MSSEQRQQQAVGAKHQALFREVNERISEVSHDQPATEQIEVLCECSNRECTDVLTVTLKDYEYVRRFPTHFLVKPGHIRRDVERVVGRYEASTVVENFGEGGRLAIRLDPRRNEESTVPRY